MDSVLLSNTYFLVYFVISLFLGGHNGRNRHGFVWYDKLYILLCNLKKWVWSLICGIYFFLWFEKKNPFFFAARCFASLIIFLIMVLSQIQFFKFFLVIFWGIFQQFFTNFHWRFLQRCGDFCFGWSGIFDHFLIVLIGWVMLIRIVFQGKEKT